MSVHKIENTVYTGTSRAAAQRVMILLQVESILQQQ
jgi:hypothetical protein